MKTKTQPNRLTESERKARRQHQIHLGKATQGYRNLQVLRQNGVIAEGPKTPDPNVPNVSKRSFDKEIREWRRKLHAFDNVDFDALKAKIYEEREHQVDPEILDELLHKEIRSLVEREMLLRKQPTKQRSRQENANDGRSELLSKHAKSRRFKEQSTAASSTSNDAKSEFESVDPVIEDNKRMIIENDVLRLKVQELTYQNTSLMERLIQQDMLLRSLITEPDNAAPQGFSNEFDDYSYMMSPSVGTEEPKWLHQALSSRRDGGITMYSEGWSPSQQNGASHTPISV